MFRLIFSRRSASGAGRSQRAHRACWLILLLTTVSCKRAPQDAAFWPVAGTRLKLPRRPGWVVDSQVRPAGPQGGVVMRLLRESAVAGSPRIDVVVTSLSDRPRDLEAYLQKNIDEMAQLESSGQVHLLHVEQHRTNVADNPAYRLHHEYMLGSGNAQISLFQVSTCLLLDGRGVTVTAAGRTELFHPLARSIADVIDSMTTSPRRGRNRELDVTPIDLGKLGEKTSE